MLFKIFNVLKFWKVNYRKARAFRMSWFCVKGCVHNTIWQQVRFVIDFYVTSLLLNGKKGLLAKSVLWSYLLWNTDRCSCQYRIQSITKFFSLTSTSMGDRNCQQTRKKMFGFFPSIFSTITLSRFTPACVTEWDVEESKKQVRRKSMNRHISIGAAVQWVSCFYCLKCTLKEVTFTKYESDGEHLEEGQKH